MKLYVHVVCLFLLLAEGHCLSFEFTDVQKAPCDTPLEPKSVLHDDAIQKAITKNWVRTHQVSKWQTTAPIRLKTLDEHPELTRYHIELTSKPMMYSETRYESLVHLPSILKKIMTTEINTSTRRQSFLVGNIEYKIVTISKIPLIGSIEVFSKSVYLSDGTIYSVHAVKTGQLPWIALWAQPVVRQKVKESIQDYQKGLAHGMCEH